MTAMTRSFAGAGHLATRDMAAYYARRAAHGVGLVLTESTAVHPSGEGYPTAPHLYSAQQAVSWTQVTAGVHNAGSPIFSQLIHCGRITHPDYTDGHEIVSSTDRRAEGIIRRNGKEYGQPRRLRRDDLPGIYELFRQAALYAFDAGFDGVELHLAHGYLADQFLDARVNDRVDDYGGSVVNRCRFALELISELLDTCGPARLMVRISPSRWMNGTYDWPDMEQMIAYLIPALDRIGLRLLDVSCARSDYFETAGRAIRQIRPLWPHFMMGGASLSMAHAQAEVDEGLLDMVTYGRLLLANADLVERFRDGRRLEPFEASLLETLS